MTTARAHMIVRRKAKDGTQGNPGATPRFSTYTAGVAYMSGSNGERFYDVVFHVGYQQFFRCIRSYPASETHAPSQSSSNTYWEWQQGLESLIVDCLCANNAFLNNLFVRHLNAADGTFKGGIQIPFSALSAAALSFMYTTTEMHDPHGQTQTVIYHYQLNATSAKYIDISEHVVDYSQAVELHIPYATGLDGYRVVIACPRAIMGFNWGAGFRLKVPSGGYILSPKIIREQDEQHEWPTVEEVFFDRGGLIEMIIHNEDGKPVVYITSGDI